LILIWLTFDVGRASVQGGFKILTPTGVLGALAGYQVTVLRRKGRGIVGPYDDWSRFFGSWMTVVIGIIVLAGSIGIAWLIKVIYDAVV